MVDEWNKRNNNIVDGNVLVQVGRTDVESNCNRAWPSCHQFLGSGKSTASYNPSTITDRLVKGNWQFMIELLPTNGELILGVPEEVINTWLGH